MGSACTRKPKVLIRQITPVPIENESDKYIYKNDKGIPETDKKLLPISNYNTGYNSNVLTQRSSNPYYYKSSFNGNTIGNDEETHQLKRTASKAFYKINQNLEFIKGSLIGTGKIGSVYSGLSINTGEIVAIKSVKLNRNSHLQKQIFQINEAVEKLAELKHKNIIKYMCTQPSESDYEIDIILEYCNGGSIQQLLEKFDSFDEKLIKLYVKQILEGLVYLHEQGIVHRSIKNCNVLVDGNGTVKLSDFVVSNILIGDDPEAILYFNTNNGKGNI